MLSPRRPCGRATTWRCLDESMLRDIGLSRGLYAVCRPQQPTERFVIERVPAAWKTVGRKLRCRLRSRINGQFLTRGLKEVRGSDKSSLCCSQNGESTREVLGADARTAGAEMTDEMLMKIFLLGAAGNAGQADTEP